MPGDLLLEPVRMGMLKHAYTIPAAAVEIVRAELGNDGRFSRICFIGGCEFEIEIENGLLIM